MPLLMIVGWPSSGKTTVANKIIDHLKAQGKVCELISDEYLLQKEGRNRLFRDSKIEKEVRSTLKAAVLRNLRSDVVVVLDSMNYIKGYRYELYCLSKEHRTTHCIVELVLDKDRVMHRNANRVQSDRYEEDLMQKLIQRYESPDSRNRWDSPLIPVIDDEIPMPQIGAALFDRAPPPANLSTQSQPVSDSDYLTRLDVKSREVVQLVLKAQDDGNHTSIIVPVLRSAISLQRPVSAIELNKLRRQFINYNKTHPATSDQQIIGNFVQFIQSNITDSN